MSATTIAFRCTQCNKSLRAPIEAAGKKAQCIGCGATVSIPVVQDLAWPPGAGPKPPSAPPATPARPSIPVATPVQPSTVKPAPAQAQIPIATPVSPPAVTPTSSQPPRVTPVQPPPPASTQQLPKPPAYGVDVIVPVPPSLAESALEIDEFELDLPPTPRAAPAAPTAPVASSQTARRRKSRNVGVDDVVARAWQIYKANLGSLVGTFLVVFFMIGITGGVATVALKALGIVDLTDTSKSDQWQSVVAGHLMRGITVFFVLGGFAYLVNLARGRGANVGDVFGAGGIFLSGLIVWVLLLVPMLALEFVMAQLGLSLGQEAAVTITSSIAMTYFLWLPFVVALADRQSNPIDAVEHAMLYVARHFFTVLGLFVVSLCVFVVSTLACGVGLLFGIPFILLMLTVAYTSNVPEA